MVNFIICIILVLVLGLAIRYIYKSKKSGKKCIGCPGGCSCDSNKHSCGCGLEDDSIE